MYFAKFPGALESFGEIRGGLKKLVGVGRSVLAPHFFFPMFPGFPSV